jgi:hypothetical protein
MIGDMIESPPPPPPWQLIAAWTVWTVIVVLVWVPILQILWRRLRRRAQCLPPTSDREPLDNGRPTPAGIWILFATLSALMLIPVMVMTVTAPAIGPLINSAAGGCFVWGIVRWMNRRHAKRPPDSP